MVEMVILRSRYPKNFLYKNHQIQLFLTSNYPYFQPGPLTQDPKKLIPPPLYPLCTVRARRYLSFFIFFIQVFYPYISYQKINCIFPKFLSTFCNIRLDPCESFSAILYFYCAQGNLQLVIGLYKCCQEHFLLKRSTHTLLKSIDSNNALMKFSK